ncbi:hypothetical protein L6227_21655 [Pseudomonas syringae pv. syringae]|uniref:hypothetical protein n=1 Tax=Pseudomonas TaxID=286 RepID=UPI000CD3398F|nr:hypothetical protein [Pseudomonas syringae]MCH5535098.1 hypothetical protein [Pseudomonas syringae pv. syringae]MCH5551873.1 hypothetical protein [Pseudomonas syringae pv. syringae]MCH5571676.1 hypothetical protein [Pseudomonas syringae pv. syringae]SOQ04310.1 hypothetical protein CFBP4215_05064 [Pseudomonas syringae pv. syringae]
MSSKLNKAFNEYLIAGSLSSMKNTELADLLRESNVIIPSKDMSHDELIKALRNEMALVEKKDIVESFLIGLERGEPQKRAALSAYAIMLNFPDHLLSSHDDVRCDICGAFKQQEIDFTFCNIVRHLSGVVISGLPDQMYFFLRESHKEHSEKPESVSSLEKLLNIIRSSDSEDTPIILEKKIRNALTVKMSKEESRGLLDLLGHIGVLESPEHKGFIDTFKNLGLVPRKSRSTDWSYPVDFWKGEYGVNEKAVDFWFGDYLKCTG